MSEEWDESHSRAITSKINDAENSLIEEINKNQLQNYDIETLEQSSEKLSATNPSYEVSPRGYKKREEVFEATTHQRNKMKESSSTFRGRMKLGDIFQNPLSGADVSKFNNKTLTLVVVKVKLHDEEPLSRKIA